MIIDCILDRYDAEKITMISTIAPAIFTMLFLNMEKPGTE